MRTVPPAAERRPRPARRRTDRPGPPDDRFSGTIVVSQLGIVVSETLQASGLDMAEANRQAGIAAGI
ncbi:hypothetical protein M2302_003805 [Micromonospora sp. A200]|uniref:hypothetical protein n=1 Tax=Micromonospora sp. A200 TaxID=2940568 RepID=UPI00247356DC|nr:hypothetical protein [Micromonospora sp. A200]MDH6463610.1 hypothetical protein [Micromonospora sp. A200]